MKKIHRKHIILIILSPLMKSSEKKVEDTEENRQICMKYCGSCPTYKHNSLEKFEPRCPLLRTRDIIGSISKRGQLLLPCLRDL